MTLLRLLERGSESAQRNDSIERPDLKSGQKLQNLVGSDNVANNRARNEAITGGVSTSDVDGNDKLTNSGTISKEGLSQEQAKPSSSSAKDIPSDCGNSKTENLRENASSEVRVKVSEPAKLFSKAFDSVTPADWIDLYHSLSIRGVLQSTAANCILVGRENSHLYFWLDETKGSLFDDSHIQRLNDVMTDFFAQPVKVFVELKSLPKDVETPALYQVRRLHELKGESLQKLSDNPVVQLLQSDFGAIINEESVRFDKTRIH